MKSISWMPTPESKGKASCEGLFHFEDSVGSILE
jgi:hypothetical protein